MPLAITQYEGRSDVEGLLMILGYSHVHNHGVSIQTFANVHWSQCYGRMEIDYIKDNVSRTTDRATSGHKPNFEKSWFNALDVQHKHSPFSGRRECCGVQTEYTPNNATLPEKHHVSLDGCAIFRTCSEVIHDRSQTNIIRWEGSIDIRERRQKLCLRGTEQ